MQTLLKALSRLSLRLFFRPVIGSRLPLAFQRRWMAALTRVVPGPGGIDRSDLWAGSVRIARFRKPLESAVGVVDPADRDAVLFVHGGGFQLGGGDAYAGFAGWLAEVTGADVYMPDYRLAPEDPHPAPTDDVFAAYRAVVELGHDPRRLGGRRRFGRRGPGGRDDPLARRDGHALARGAGPDLPVAGPFAVRRQHRRGRQP